MTNKLKQRKKTETSTKENDSNGSNSGTICNSETSLDNNVSLSANEGGEKNNFKSSDLFHTSEKILQKNGIEMLTKKKPFQDAAKRLPCFVGEFVQPVVGIRE